MKTSGNRFARNFNTLILSALAFGLAGMSHVSAAGDYVWSGTGTDGNWSTAANWQGNVAPTGAGNDLTFTSGTNLTITSNNNGQLTAVDSLNFSSATSLSFTLESTTDTTLTLGPGTAGTNRVSISNQASGNATETIDMNLDLTGGFRQYTRFQTSTGDTTLLGLPANTLNLNGTTLVVTGTSSTSIGTTEIDSQITGAGSSRYNGAVYVGDVLTGAGNLILTNDANNYTAGGVGQDATQLAGGTLTVEGNTVLGTGSLGINNDPTNSSGVTVTLASKNGGNPEGDTIVLGNVVNVNSSFNVAPDANGTLELHGQVNLLPNGSGSQVLLNGDTAGTVVITNSTAGSFTPGTNTGAIIFSGGIAGTANLTLSGNGGVTGLPGGFTGTPNHFIFGTNTASYDVANTYTGTVNVVDGALLDLEVQAGTYGAVITGDLTIDNTSMVRELLDNQIASTSNVTVNGELDLNFSDHVTPPGAGAQTINSLQGTNANAVISITDVAPVSGSSDLEITNLVGTGSSYAGLITGGSTGSNVLTLDAGTLVLYGGSGSSQSVIGNNYYGTTTVDDGATLQAGTGSGGSGRFGYAFSANSDYVLDPSTLDLNGNNETIGSLAGTGTVLNSAIGTTAVLTIGGTNASTTFAGVIEDNSGTGGQIALVLDMSSVSNPGTLDLTGNSTYSGVVIPGDTGGDTLIKNGTLEVSVNNALPTGTNITLNSDGGTANGGTANDGDEKATLAIDAAISQTINNLTLVAAGFTNSSQGSTAVTIGSGGTLTVAGAISVVDNTTSPGFEIAPTIEGGTLNLSGHTTAISVAGQEGNFADAPNLYISSVVANGGISYTGIPSDGTFNYGNVGALELDAVNTYALGTTINAGTLIVGSNSNTIIGGVTYSQALGTGFVNNAGGTNFSFLVSAAFSELAANASPDTAQNILVGTTGTPQSYSQGINGSLDLGVANSVGGTPTAANDYGAGVAGVNYDTVTVTGSATQLAGNLTLYFGSGSTPSQGQHYVVLTSQAGPVGTTATFSEPNSAAGTYLYISPTTFSGGTVTNLAAPFTTITTYNDTFGGTEAADSVIVTLFKPFASFAGLTQNQTNVANNVDTNVTVLNNKGLLTSPTGFAADFFNNIVGGLNASTYNGTLGQSLDQLSPQRFEILHNVAFDNYALDVQTLDDEFARERNGAGGIDTSGFAFNDSTLGPELSEVKGRLLAWNPAPDNGLLSDSSPSVLGGADMSTSKDMKETVASAPLNTWNAFVDGGVDLGDLEHNADNSHSSYTTARVRGGIDYRVTTDLQIGALFGYGHTDADLDNEGSKAHIDSYTPGLYASYADKSGFYANALFTGGVNDYSTDRDVVIPGVNRVANGSTSGVQLGGNLDGGYEFHRGAWTFGPSAGLTYVNMGIDSFNETGAGAANLAVNNQSDNSLRSRLGGTVSYDFKAGSVVVTPHASAFWQHEFLAPATSITSQFEGSPAGAFSVTTTRGDGDNALLGFGVDAGLNKTFTLFIDYQAEAGGSTFFGQSAEGGVKVGF